MQIDIYNTDNKYDLIYTDPAWKQTKGNKRKCRPNQGKEWDTWGNQVGILDKN